MEVAGGDDVDRTVIGNKDDRVIVDRVQFDVDHPLGVGDGVAHRAVNLGHAAQRVGVLHVARIVAAHQAAAVQKAAQEVGAVDLARMGAQGVDAGVVGAVGAVQRLQ